MRSGIIAALLAMASAVGADPPAQPTGVTATIVSSTSIRVTWDAVVGAESYDVRRNGALIDTSSTNSYSDTGATAGAAHIYSVRAIGPGGTSSWSASALALTTTFTDTTLIPRLTKIQDDHVDQLRDAINTLRAAAMLSLTSFSDPSLAGLHAKALHVNELRSSLDEARSTLGLSAMSYTNTLTAGATTIHAVDLEELRGGAIGSSPDALFWNSVVIPAAVQAIGCNASHVFIGAPGNIRRSSDGGATWSDSSGLPAGQNISAIANGGDGYLFAQTANDRVHRSTNDGETWSELATTPAPFTTLLGARNGLFAAGGACGSVWFSADGTSWIARNTGISGCVTALARARHGRLYAGTAANGVFTSADDDSSWSAVGAGIPAGTIHAITSDRDESVFISVDGQGVVRSIDDGNTWTSVNTGDFRSLMTDSTGTLVAGTETDARIHTSSDGGDSWLIASNGLPPAGEIDALCSTHRYRFAAIDGKLFRAPVAFRMHGLNFSPFLDGQNENSVVDVQQLLDRLNVIRPYTQWIRTFRVSNGLQHIARIARTLGLKTMIGARITSDLDENAKEIAALIEIGLSGDADILAVGNEVLLTSQLPVGTLVSYIEQVQDAVPGVPVTYVDGFHIFREAANEDLRDTVDVISATIYPFWDENDIDINDAIGYIDTNLQLLRADIAGKDMLVSEAGWPTAGATTATIPNAATHFREFESWARAIGAETFYFEAFDEDWKFAEEGGPGPHWGIWDENGVIKPGLEPIVAGEWGGDEVVGGPGTASTDFTLPDYEEDFTLRGNVEHVVPNDYRVAVFIRVGGLWYSKPYEDARLTWIRGNGEWSALIKTHENDLNATEIAAYVLPDGYTPPYVHDVPAIPSEIVTSSVASHHETRTP